MARTDRAARATGASTAPYFAFRGEAGNLTCLVLMVLCARVTCHHPPWVNARVGKSTLVHKGPSPHRLRAEHAGVVVGIAAPGVVERGAEPVRGR